jgi:hypothetical protein
MTGIDEVVQIVFVGKRLVEFNVFDSLIKLLLPPRQNRGISLRIRARGLCLAPGPLDQHFFASA